MKFQKPRGMHGSFWLQSADVRVGPRRREAVRQRDRHGGVLRVDVPGRRDGLASPTSRTRTATPSKSGGLQTEISDATRKKGDAWWKKYHVFSVEWTPEAYIFRVDGVETFRQTENISGMPEFLVLSLLSSDWELPDLDKSQLPADMKVDWVRVCQQRRRLTASPCVTRSPALAAVLVENPWPDNA